MISKISGVATFQKVGWLNICPNNSRMFQLSTSHDILFKDYKKMHGRPRNFFQGGSNIILIVRGGSKPKNFAVWMGQNPKFPVYMVKKKNEPGRGSSDPV